MCWKESMRWSQQARASSQDCFQNRFFKWLLFFKSPSYCSSQQNPLNLKKKGGLPPFLQQFQEREGEGRATHPPADVFRSGTLSLRAPWMEAGGFLSFLSTILPSTSPFYNSVILIIPLHLLYWVFIIYNTQKMLNLKRFL